MRKKLTRDGFADTLFECRIPRCPARHRDGKAGRCADREAAWPVGEKKPRQAEALVAAADEVGSCSVATAILDDGLDEPASRQHLDLLFEAELADRVRDERGDLGAGWIVERARARSKTPKYSRRPQGTVVARADDNHRGDCVRSPRG